MFKHQTLAWRKKSLTPEKGGSRATIFRGDREAKGTEALQGARGTEAHGIAIWGVSMGHGSKSLDFCRDLECQHGLRVAVSIRGCPRTNQVILRGVPNQITPAIFGGFTSVEFRLLKLNVLMRVLEDQLSLGYTQAPRSFSPGETRGAIRRPPFHLKGDKWSAAIFLCFF